MGMLNKRWFSPSIEPEENRIIRKDISEMDVGKNKGIDKKI